MLWDSLDVPWDYRYQGYLIAVWLLPLKYKIFIFSKIVWALIFQKLQNFSSKEYRKDEVLVLGSTVHPNNPPHQLFLRQNSLLQLLYVFNFFMKIFHAPNSHWASKMLLVRFPIHSFGLISIFMLNIFMMLLHPLFKCLLV